MVGGFKDGTNAAWIDTFDDSNADFDAVIFELFENRQKIFFGLGMENDKVRMKLNKSVDVLGRRGGYHMNVGSPAFWPPNGAGWNGSIASKRAVRNINMDALSETIILFYDSFVLGWILAKNSRSNNGNWHVLFNSRLVFVRVVYTFRLEEPQNLRRHR